MKAIVYFAMTLLLLAFAAAGSIGGLDNEDCTKTEDVCVHQHCSHWWHGSCIDWDCDQWEEQCDEHIDTVINDDNVDIDADTVGGNSAEDFYGAIDDEANDRATGDEIISGYIGDNEAGWAKDETGGGISSWWVSRLLVGYMPEHGSLWDTYDNFMLYLNKRFTPKDETAALRARVARLEAEIDLLKESLDVQISDTAIEAKVGLTESADTGDSVTTESGMVCDADIGDYCLIVTPIETPPVPGAQVNNTQALLDLYNYRLQLLGTWQPLCDKNIGAWCDIIAKRKAEWGMS